jgi:zinc transport system ATP-binding protein
MSDAPVIEISDLDFSYNDVPILEDVNLTIGDRELVCIVGPNGGGKTTLMKLIMGQLKPDRGTIRVFGQRPHQIRDRIGYLPQHAVHDPRFPITVMEVVLMGRVDRTWIGRYSRQDKEASRRALEEMGMSGYAESPFSRLSGGQRQRVMIARALSTEPDLLVLDEPTTNVDLILQNRLYDILHELSQRMTVLTVTHDLVSELVEEVVCVNRNVHIHPTSEVMEDSLADLYAGVGRMVHHDRHTEEGGGQDG